ncbi:MAG: threonine--tRNA ligase [Candidatus Vogelbacteria bacterium CG10_big_fil_rev_8_21_14_0_10_51_16]|uniref:Threonine--tRNA ligase n=1 Tax=Candidatus Vogelbacteria bacterium CG10_big_fil_rev_8_21_14_0_10_51_16 TaxID=1975045 RepID=A0A2H0RFK5_9BACT|nr:MAG: threonine--tRNA ligase [Candidatus Vogelbacteria bacterium CG10_big_fil_rev_8_21_14_0_10_51_16]
MKKEDSDHLDHIRHTLAHLLAWAVQERDPSVELAIGPTVEHGFYYDMLLSTPLSADDLPALEKRVRALAKEGHTMTGREVSYEEARELFKSSPFKLEMIDELHEKGEKLTAYTLGDPTSAHHFTDLCRGGHVENTKEIPADAFKLDKLAGAYWRGSEKNPMLTRVYGLAFATKVELDEHLAMLEEAQKRDHRKIGREQDLFVFSDLVGSGMPLFTPRGATVRGEIVRYSREMNDRLGFGEVHTPNINKGELFKISGHYDKYKDDMLAVSSQYVGDEMFLKPMNCPQHTQIYDSQPRSYRDLPIRYADFANLYRDERPGELSGLARLRCFVQDDGHIFCREDQIEGEIGNVLAVIKEVLATYKIGYWMRLSLRDPEQKEKYLGGDEVWERSEPILRKLLTEQEIEFTEAVGEAAFYGPKIDIMAVDALKREWQVSTIQLDFNMPGRFGLEYTDADGAKKTPVMIHRALVGSPERFLGILIEHYAGAFPTWLAPVQVAILPISEKHLEYAKQVAHSLKSADIRVELDAANESLGKKIRNAKMQKIPYFLVLGDKEMGANAVGVESRDKGQLGAMKLEQFVDQLADEIRNRK